MNKCKNINIFCLILLCAISGDFLFTACENPVMATWWPDEYGKSGVNFGVVVFDIGFVIPNPNSKSEGPQPKAVNVAWGKTVGRLRPISRDGMGFAGWFDEQGKSWNVETRSVERQDDVNGDGVITLHAKWEVLYYTVTFQENGGTPSVAAQRIAYNAMAVEPAPIQNGGVAQGFGGWWLDNGPPWENQWNFADNTVTKNITLHARWETTTRTVHFQPNGGMRPGILQGGNAANAEMSPTSFTIYVSPETGGKILDPGPLVKEGYAFDGWYTDPNFSDKSLWNFSADRIKEPDPPLHDENKIVVGLGDPFYLYAKWIPNLYLVTFIADGGTPAPANQQIEYGHKATQPPVITKADMAFRGWYTINLNGTEPTSAHDVSIWNFNNEVTNNLTLYAGWSAKVYTVVFHLGNLPAGVNSVYKKPADQNVISGGSALEPFMPSLPSSNKTSWSFLGWYSSKTPAADSDPSIINDKNQTEAERSEKLAVAQWNFSTAINASNTNNGVLNLYARWVEPAPDMIWVPRGSFVMGDTGVSGTPADYHSYPARRVTLDGFYIGRYEVTQKTSADTNPSYTDIMTINPSQFYKNDVRPVDRVSWYDAVEYCNKLTIWDPKLPNTEQVYTITGIQRGTVIAQTADRPNAPDLNTPPPGYSNKGAYSITNATVTADFSKRGYRLPTEAEWEYAARGGNNSPGNYTYSGSNDSTLVAWYNDTIKTGADAGSTQTVGTKSPNALGIYDMSGNITEWVWDWFNPYKSSYYFTDYSTAKPVTPAAAGILNPRGPTGGTERVRRGGGWSNAAGNVRSVVRNSQAPGEATWVNGFRVARGPSQIW